MVTKVLNGAEECNNKNTWKDMGILKVHRQLFTDNLYFVYIILISRLTTGIHGHLLKDHHAKKVQ